MSEGMNEANKARSSRARAGDPLPPRSSFLAGRSRGPGTSCPWCSGCSRGPGPKPVGPQVGAGAGAVRTRGNSRLLLASEGPPPGQDSAPPCRSVPLLLRSSRPGGRRLPSRTPPGRCPSPARSTRNEGGCAERRGGLLAGVQRVALSPLAQSFASGQEAELRERPEAGAAGAPLPPRPGPSPAQSAACASAPQLAQLCPDPQAPQTYTLLAPAFTVSGLGAPCSTLAPMIGKQVSQCEHGGAHTPGPRELPWFVGWGELAPPARQSEPLPYRVPRSEERTAPPSGTG